MYLKDHLGSFEIIVDKERRVVHEKLSGMFTLDDSKRLEREYRNSVIPYLGDGAWVKLCDMREYMLNSSVGPADVNYFIQRVVPFGFIGGSVIVTSQKLISQLSIAIINIDEVTFEYFTNEVAADEYLKSLGF